MANYGNAWAAVKAMSWNGQKGVVGSVCGDKLVPWLLQQLHAQILLSFDYEHYYYDDSHKQRMKK
uniref:Uncharacterized protein n=1 Tax=Pristionchus pacificus TaxID=54126 RepID=A0A2A6BS15_PRIPA|eukprot:PDM68729.1 hypothetical protein PRIPAC_47031 [Pristionchus pacificus]